MGWEGYSELLRPAWRDALYAGRGTDPIARWRQYDGHPVEFCEEILGLKHWQFQCDLLNELVKRRAVTLRGCHKSSKSHTLAEAILYFMCTAETTVLAIMPTADQLKEVIFDRLRDVHAHSKTPLPGIPSSLSWFIAPGHRVTGMSTNNPHRVHGRHAGVTAPADPNADLADQPKTQEETAAELAGFERFVAQSKPSRIFLILDEAPGIPQYVYDGLAGTRASAQAYEALAGNPVQSPFAPHFFPRSHANGSRYVRFHISARPGHGDEMGAEYRYEHVPDWIMPADWPEQEIAALGGPESPMALGKVFGRFSVAIGERYVVPYEFLRKSAEEMEGWPGLGPRMGVDVARTRDRCCAVLFFDGIKIAEHIWRPDSTDEKALMTVALTVVRLAKKWGRELGEMDGSGWSGNPIPGGAISVDATGLGAGVCDRMAELGWSVDRANFGFPVAHSHHKELQGSYVFPTERDRLHCVYRTGIERGLFVIPEKFHSSWEEAQWPLWEERYGKQGVEFKVEAKDKVVERHHRSPDVLDADMLATARRTRTGRLFATSGERRAKAAGGVGTPAQRRAAREAARRAR